MAGCVVHYARATQASVLEAAVTIGCVLDVVTVTTTRTLAVVTPTRNWRVAVTKIKSRKKVARKKIFCYHNLPIIETNNNQASPPFIHSTPYITYTPHYLHQYLDVSAVPHAIVVKFAKSVPPFYL